jgi:hypothetical protein
MQHFMKQSTIISVLVFCTLSVQAQISGIVSDSYPIPGIRVSIENSQIETSSDFDGMYLLDFPDNIEKINLNFELNIPGSLGLEILNLKIRKPKFTLDVSIPTYKTITASEYNNLSNNEKKNYKRKSVHYNQIEIYESNNQLDKNFVLIKFDDKEYIIHDYQLDLERNKIVINWAL